MANPWQIVAQVPGHDGETVIRERYNRQQAESEAQALSLHDPGVIVSVRRNTPKGFKTVLVFYYLRTN